MTNEDSVLKKAARQFHKEDTVIELESGSGTIAIGGGEICLIAGPCTIESREQLLETAKSVKESGASILRAGAFKPRTSPYSFQGLGEEGLRYLKEAKELTGLPTVSEIMDISQIEMFRDVDILQVGSKNMQNFSLLKELGKVDKPILLKHAFGCTVQEFLLAAEYILAYGNEHVILCERGTRSFETETRFSLDLSIVPLLKERTHLPIIVDPSHATGRAELIEPMAKAACVIGADGIMIEVHNEPECALCDGNQAVTYEQFERIAKGVRDVSPFAYRR